MKVFFRRGRRINVISGTFYGFGLGGKTIRVNSNNIPVFDLTTESKALFDREANIAFKRDHVEKLVKAYQMDRRRYADQLYNQEKAKIREFNEKLGYIYYKDKWVPAETVLKDLLKDTIKEAKERDEREKREREEQEKKNSENGGGQPQGKNEEEDNADNM